MAEVKEITRKLEEIRELIRAEIPWEPVGPTPMPEIPDLRAWDMRLLKTYKPWSRDAAGKDYSSCLLDGMFRPRRSWRPYTGAFD